MSGILRVANVSKEYPRSGMALRDVSFEMQKGEFVFVAGGILEVQPDCVTVLSDTAVRGKDLDEEKANQAKQAAEEAVKNAKSDIDLARAQTELAIMAAQLSALRKYRSKK